MGAFGGDMMGGMGLNMGMYNMPGHGAFFENPNETHKQAQFSQAGKAYSAYRPEQEQARMNALRNSMSAYQGANNALATMYGGQSVDPTQMQKSPMGPSMMKQGQSQGVQVGAPPQAPGAGISGMLKPKGR